VLEKSRQDEAERVVMYKLKVAKEAAELKRLAVIEAEKLRKADEDRVKAL
jgi:hypothetical protein